MKNKPAFSTYYRPLSRLHLPLLIVTIFLPACLILALNITNKTVTTREIDKDAAQVLNDKFKDANFYRNVSVLPNKNQAFEF